MCSNTAPQGNEIHQLTSRANKRGGSPVLCTGTKSTLLDMDCTGRNPRLVNSVRFPLEYIFGIEVVGLGILDDGVIICGGGQDVVMPLLLAFLDVGLSHSSTEATLTGVELWRMLKKGQYNSSLPAWQQFYKFAAAG